jgi:glycosyltransferase involved in cell wall biosynthesis
MSIDLLDLADAEPSRPRVEPPPRPWRLAFVHASARRALDTRAGALSRLVAEGFEVHVFAPSHPALAEIEALGATAHPLPAGAGASPAPTAAAFLILQSAFAQRRFLIAHGEGGAMPWITAWSASRADVPAVVSTVDAHAFATPDLGPLTRALEPYLQVAEDRAFAWLGAHSTAYLVTTTEAIAQARELGVDPSHIEPLVGGDGADHDRFHPDLATRDAARAALGVPDHWEVTVGACGALDARRGARELTRLARELGDHAGLVVAARAPLDPALREALDARGDRALVLAGEVDRMDLFHRAVDLFVAPRRTLHIPTAVHEALATGTPVVGYATDATAAIVTHNGSGALAPTGDADALLGYVRDLSSRPERLARMGEAAASSSRRKWSRRLAHQRLLAIYESALQRGLTGG